MKKRLELTPRLRLAADWVPQGAALADIGTDHAYLPVWLLLQGRLRSCIASDLRWEPLRRARDTASRYGAAGIQFRLCDGLGGIQPQEADTIVIAGLGGENIAEILSKAPWTADGGHRLLLQPMSRPEALRSFLSKNGYAIRREALALERETLYVVMEASGGRGPLTLGQLYGGAKLLHDPLGNRYLIETILRLQNAVAGLGRSASTGHPGRADHLREILGELLEMREAWRNANGGRN